jgi:hypothetical protein
VSKGPGQSKKRPPKARNGLKWGKSAGQSTFSPFQAT